MRAIITNGQLIIGDEVREVGRAVLIADDPRITAVEVQDGCDYLRVRWCEALGVIDAPLCTAMLVLSCPALVSINAPACTHLRVYNCPRLEASA